jgi:carbamoyltransferase
LNATLAYDVQRALEVQLTAALGLLAERARAAGVEPNVCLSGGTALNSVANQIAFRASPFERIHLHPACGDDGTAIGAALWYWHGKLGQPRRHYTNAELMYSRKIYDDEIETAATAHGAVLRVERCDDYCRHAARLLADGYIVGWFQGGSEIGPRALGHRSILADPRDPAMKERLNGRVKFREAFRPFAPSVLNDCADEWFGLADSPFMLRVCGVRKDGIPAVTHVDRTARVQTVRAEDNPAFYDLISSFYANTGVPLLLNTSFNLGGEPIVENPADAISTLLRSGLDCLVIGDRLVHKVGVPDPVARV